MTDKTETHIELVNNKLNWHEILNKSVVKEQQLTEQLELDLTIKPD